MNNDELNRKWREEEARADADSDEAHCRRCPCCGRDFSRDGIVHTPCRCPICGKDHREDHRGSEGGWVDFPDHTAHERRSAFAAKLLVP